jgi:hypothetical protein
MALIGYELRFNKSRSTHVSVRDFIKLKIAAWGDNINICIKLILREKGYEVAEALIKQLFLVVFQGPYLIPLCL